MSRCPNCGFDQGHNHKRSNPDHNRLFGLIRAAFHQWPEWHPFEPQNELHLRKWLIVMAGPEFHVAQQTWITNNEEMRAIVKEAKKGDLDRFAIGDGPTLSICEPKSIAFNKMGQAEFGRLRDAITDIIEQTIGCKVEDLMQEAA